MSLEITKTRKIVADFYAPIEGNEFTDREMVKRTEINISAQGVSTIQETMLNEDLYSKNRKLMRQHEQQLRDLRYEQEDQILSELEEDETTTEGAK